ncbi:MAG: ribose 5-phosphate isomerase B [Clostridiales bacterium]|jgi:ribose-5-phosphate isomerase B|nr:ribose 5-phosphate isomerase B [Clostridiales bacterium]
MKIGIASDHGGFELKEYLKEYLKKSGIEVSDFGTNSEEPVDYPIYGERCARAVANGEVERGVVCCGTGIGISIAANKVAGIRCALCTDDNMARLSRQHNNANMLALGGRITSNEEAQKILDAWLITEFEGGRHQRRIDMIDNIK